MRGPRPGDAPEGAAWDDGRCDEPMREGAAGQGASVEAGGPVSAPEVGDRYGLRVLPSWPYHCAHVGDVIPLPRCDRDEVERVRRAMPNGHHMEVVTLDEGEAVGDDGLTLPEREALGDEWREREGSREKMPTARENGPQGHAGGSGAPVEVQAADGAHGGGKR